MIKFIKDAWNYPKRLKELQADNAKLCQRNIVAVEHIRSLVKIVEIIRNHDLPIEHHNAKEFAGIE